MMQLGTSLAIRDRLTVSDVLTINGVRNDSVESIGGICRPGAQEPHLRRTGESVHHGYS